MPVTPITTNGGWTNYHGTGTSHNVARFGLREAGLAQGRDEIAAAGDAVCAWLARARQQGKRVRPLGAGWSPSNINIANDGWLLHTRRFNRMFRIASADVQPHRDASALFLVEAGALVDEVCDKLEAAGRSMWTTGAGNGQTLAGACATGTHGSMVGRGGIQDHLVAVQIVTPSGVHWVERSDGVMTDNFVAATRSQLHRDDELFEAVRLPVGSMGIVTAMVIDTVPKFLVRPIQNLRVIDRAAIETLSSGDFRSFSKQYALDVDPDFVQVILNPYGPFKRPAMLRFLYREDWRSNYPRAAAAQVGAGYDSLSILGHLLNSFPWVRGRLLQFAMKQGYASGPDVDDPAVYATWGEALDTHRPLADLFNASVTVSRRDLLRALDVINAVYRRKGGSTVITLRFMAQAKGLLTPARFEHNAVIDFDGPRSDRTAAAYAAVTTALDEAGLLFTRHWGKSCQMDAARVAMDYGDDLVRWKAARDRLNPALADRDLFRTPVLDGLGLTI